MGWVNNLSVTTSVTEVMRVKFNNSLNFNKSKETLFTSGTFSNLSDEELDNLLRSAQQSHPNIGIRMAKGLLHSKGYRVQREWIRQSFLRTDPIGVMQRWRDAVRRRRYNVYSPLALWHIDGNHKLIR